MIVGLLRKLQCLIPQFALLTTCKTFVRSHFDFGDIIYEQAYYSSFNQVEFVQPDAYLAIIGVIRITLNKKLYDPLSFTDSWENYVTFTNITKISSVSFQIISFKTFLLHH